MTEHQMLLTEIPLNPSVKEKDELRLSKQAVEIYNLLQLGPARTSELATIGLQYNARINEIRHAICHQGLMIDEVEGEGGDNSYTIVNIEQSKFWKKVKVKNEVWKWEK